ncbi:MAG: ribosome maturation factor RimP [Alphaproteobacteria bacterium]|jgi:ribosome maturation factor RimP|nr:ribosome maturation factor RimP [Alphaproteobacteria bacterium]
MSTQQEKKITNFLEPVIADLGYDLVSIKVIGSQKLQTLQIMAEDPQTQTLDLDGCTKISRAVSTILDVEDPFSSPYQLEISSPGIDRPLVRPKDFEANIGFEANIETENPSETGQKKYRGKILSFENETVTLSTDTGEVQIELAEINKAKLILTDELIKANQNKRPKQQDQHQEE